MESVSPATLATLRAVVGYLGEKEQFNWWPCSFFGPGSRAFLTPVFSRTALLAQLTAVSAAAARLHDEFLGTGTSWHLFRLPEDLEQDIHAFWADSRHTPQLREVTQQRDAALAYLQRSSQEAAPHVGPIRIGDFTALRTVAAWQHAAGEYATAFAQGSRTYPYFTDRSE
jgi:hypothetical protein